MSEEILRPNGNGNASYGYWTASAGNKWECVDEAVFDDSDYVYETVDYQDECFAFANTSASSGQTINSVTVHGQFNAGGTETIRLSTRTHTGASSGVSGNITIGAAYADKTYAMATNPITAAAWTSANIDDYDFGMQTRNISTQVNCAQFWIVVDYTSSSAIKTVNGLAKTSVKTVDGLAIASVKTWEGLA